MQLKKLIVTTLASVALCGSLLSAPAFAEKQPLATMQGIEAQALSATEMDAIHGAELTPQEAAYLARLDASVQALIAKVQNPVLAARLSAAWAVTLSKLTAFLTKT